MHLRVTHESTGAYFQLGPYFTNNNTKYLIWKKRNVGKIWVIIHTQGTFIRYKNPVSQVKEVYTNNAIKQMVHLLCKKNQKYTKELSSHTLQFVIITQFVINYKLRWIATQFVIHRISNCVVMATRFVMYYKLRQNFIILKYW